MININKNAGYCWKRRTFGKKPSHFPIVPASHKTRLFKNADRRTRHCSSPFRDPQTDIVASKTSQKTDRNIETYRLDVLTPGHRRDTKCSENDIEWGDVDHSVSCSARLANSLEVFDIIWRDNTLLSRHLHVDQVCLHKHQAVKTAIGTLGTQPFIGSFINCRPESIVTIGQEIAVDFVLGKLSVLIILITVTSLLTINLWRNVFNHSHTLACCSSETKSLWREASCWILNDV